MPEGKIILPGVWDTHMGLRDKVKQVEILLIGIEYAAADPELYQRWIDLRRAAGENLLMLKLIDFTGYCDARALRILRAGGQPKTTIQQQAEMVAQKSKVDAELELNIMRELMV